MSKKSVKLDRSQDKLKTEHDSHKMILEEKLIENIVELQKVHTNLAEKFDKLTKELSNLLSLFEVAARSFSESPGVVATEKDKKFLEKIDQLLDQNKTIAKGLVLVEDRIRERIYSPAKTEVKEEEEKKEDLDQLQPSLGTRPLPHF